MKLIEKEGGRNHALNHARQNTKIEQQEDAIVNTTDTNTPASPDFDGALKAVREAKTKYGTIDDGEYNETILDAATVSAIEAALEASCRVEVVTVMAFAVWHENNITQDGNTVSDAEYLKARKK